MSIYRENFIAEGLTHPASAGVDPRKPLSRTSKSRALSRRAELLAGRLPKAFRRWTPGEQKQFMSDPENAARLSKKQRYSRLAKLADKRATEKVNQEIPGRYHQVRTHYGIPGDKAFDITHQRKISKEQRTREDRAGRAGYSGTGSKVQTKNPKKLRKDEALKKMSRTLVPSSGYGEWSKAKLKEAYYYVLDYLLSEGYADNFEDADGIFQIMSEEWFAEILSE